MADFDGAVPGTFAILHTTNGAANQRGKGMIWKNSQGWANLTNGGIWRDQRDSAALSIVIDLPGCHLDCIVLAHPQLECCWSSNRFPDAKIEIHAQTEKR